MLAAVTRIAHAGGRAKRKGNFAGADLEMTEGIERGGFQFRKKEKQREVAMDAAHHGLHDGAPSVAFAVREPAIVAPPIILAGAGNPDGVLRQAVEALHQSIP